MLENLTVVIPFRSGHAHLGRLLDSLPEDVPVLIVDDLSDPPLRVDTDDFERQNVRVLRMHERGYFAGTVNAGIAACATDVLVLNQDVTLGQAWQTLIGDQRQQYAILGDGVMGHPAFPRGYVQGTFMFLRRDALNAAGPLNEREYPLWGCTAEWQLRACRMGFQALPLALDKSVMVHAREGNYGSSIAKTLKDEPEKQGWFIRTPPAISVIITCYNYGRYLRDAVNSLLGGETSLGVMPPQTMQSFEIVIVDDGSTDNSPELAQALADDWKGIRFVPLEKNVGSAAAANAGIAASYGKYVTMLDADDMMEPTRLEKLYALATANPHSVIYDDCYLFKDGKRFSVLPLPPYDFEKVLTKNLMHKGILYPRKAWQEVGGYPPRMREGREDWAMNVALGIKGYCGVHVKEPLYLYRREGQNRTLRNTGGDWHAFFSQEMSALFPHIYAGDRPMGCCGQGSAKAKMGTSAGAGLALGSSRRLAMNTIPGQAGMVLLEYLPDRAGTQQFEGAVTHAQYVFGGARRQGYVDTRDVAHFLELIEGHRPLFKRVDAAAEGAAAEGAGAEDAGNDAGAGAASGIHVGDTGDLKISGNHFGTAIIGEPGVPPLDPTNAAENADAPITAPSDEPAPTQAAEEPAEDLVLEGPPPDEPVKEPAKEPAARKRASSRKKK